jgi:hypothetical protein
MRPSWGRVGQHVAIVGVSLGVIGYLLGRAFLFAHRMYGGGAYDPENERVLWQTPLVMAGIGIAMTASIDLLWLFLRRPVQLPAADPAPAPKA